MTDVKIVAAGIEMTPEQARKVHAELSRLFAPAIPQITRPGLRASDWGRLPYDPYPLQAAKSPD